MDEELETIELNPTDCDEIQVCMDYIRQVMPDKKFLFIVYEKDSRPASGYLARCGSNMTAMEVGRALAEVAEYTKQTDIKTYPRRRKN